MTTDIDSLLAERGVSHAPFVGSDRSKRVRKGLVDLIIPNGAGPVVLSRLVESLMIHQDYRLSDGAGNYVSGVRLIVVSQGEHGSHSYLKSLEKRYPGVMFPIYRDKNKPPPVPYNDGLEFSARMMDPLSEYIMFLDDDMIVLRDGLVELERNHLEKYGFANVATEHCFFGDKSSLGPNGEAKDFGMGSFFFRRKLFEKVGYLDEMFDFHCSDTDFNRRVRMIEGARLGLIPDSEKYMFHEHQRGTHNFYRGNHQHVIDNDWVTYGKKWYHDEIHDRSSPRPDICKFCKEIASKQLPLGRTSYRFSP